MWLFTPRGFFSVVKYENGLNVRARSKQDLLNLADLLPQASESMYTTYTDYPWRFQCSKEEWAKACEVMAQEIDYPNFKDEVMKKQGLRRSHVYGQVWETLLAVEAEDQPLYPLGCEDLS